MLADWMHIEAAAAEEHGGDLPDPADHERPIIDFSTTVNAWGPPPMVLDAARSAPIDRYPDRDASVVRAAAAQMWKCDASELAFGAGTSELIFSVVAAIVRRGDIVIVAGPTFSEYRRAARIAGAAVAEVRVFPPGRVADVGRLCSAIRRLRPRLVFLCDPNNPTGHLLSSRDMDVVLKACAAHGALLVLDRSLQSFANVKQHSFEGVHSGSVLVLRSITKDYAIAGTRAGFMHAHPSLVKLVNSVRAPWCGSTQAQAAATAAMHPESVLHMQRTVELLRRAAVDVSREVAEIGFSVIASETHFFMMNAGNGAHAREWLVNQTSVHVRDCTSFGEGAFVRIAVRTPSENARLVAALRSYQRRDDTCDTNPISNG